MAGGRSATFVDAPGATGVRLGRQRRRRDQRTRHGRVKAGFERNAIISPPTGAGVGEPAGGECSATSSSQRTVNNGFVRAGPGAAPVERCRQKTIAGPRDGSQSVGAACELRTRALAGTAGARARPCADSSPLAGAPATHQPARRRDTEATRPGPTEGATGRAGPGRARRAVRGARIAAVKAGEITRTRRASAEGPRGRRTHRAAVSPAAVSELAARSARWSPRACAPAAAGIRQFPLFSPGQKESARGDRGQVRDSRECGPPTGLRHGRCRRHHPAGRFAGGLPVSRTPN
jgi:hypothetical protein